MAQRRGITVEQSIARAIQSAREKRPEAEVRELGRVLQRIMIGDRNVDLSGLTNELREMVERALNV